MNNKKSTIKKAVLVSTLMLCTSMANAESLFTMSAMQTYTSEPKSLYGSVRARSVGDVVTIVLNESVKTVDTLSYDSERSSMTTDNFTNLGAEKLAAAIPGCNFALKSKEENKNAINTFLTNSNEIVGTTYTLPDEAFYL